MKTMRDDGNSISTTILTLILRGLWRGLCILALVVLAALFLRMVFTDLTIPFLAGPYVKELGRVAGWDAEIIWGVWIAVGLTASWLTSILLRFRTQWRRAALAGLGLLAVSGLALHWWFARPHFLDQYGKPRFYWGLAPDGSLVKQSVPGPSPPRGASRLLQYQLVSNPVASLAVAAKLIQAKIANGRRLLQRLDANHHRLDATALGALEARERDAVSASDLASLRGSEGSAAALYFASWAQFFPVEFPFVQRSTRPPCNPVNACLSYLSALVYGELLTACVTRGLDPALGCLHQSEDGRWSLPLDLMEPFRPALTEALTLRLFSHRILQQRHFEAREGGVWLNPDGRRTLIQHYEQRVQREFLSEHAGCRTTLRQQLQHAAVQFKLALAQSETYAPFRVN